MRYFWPVCVASAWALAVGLALLLALFVFCRENSAQEKEEGEAPNIVFVLTDDQREDEMRFLPKTQSLLGEEGMTFSNSYATFPLCCPARSTIFTGLYTHNHGVEDNRGVDGGFDKFVAGGYEENSLAVALHDKGYRTGLFGKYLNGYTNEAYIPPGWDEWFAKIDTKGPAEYYDYPLSENGVKVHHAHAPEDYQTDVLAGFADEFIRSSSSNEVGGKQPFFAYVPISAPHNPQIPAPRYKDSSLPDRAKTLLAVDDLVERLVNTLQETGELDNTYFVFSTDNGWMRGEHGMDKGKRTFYEESAGTPLLIRGPGVMAGATSGEVVSNTDYAPTFADLAGVSLATNPDGRSLKPLFAGDTSGSWRKYLLLENPTQGRGPYKAVVTSTHKYVEKAGGDKLLFDLTSDPHEHTNLLGDTSYDPLLLAQLQAALLALKDCQGDTCRVAENQTPNVEPVEIHHKKKRH